VDRSAIAHLYDFTGFAWDQIVEAAGPGEEILSRPAPGSGWPALRHCLGHMVLTYERWLPAIVEGKTLPVPDVQEDNFRTWASLETHRRRVRETFLSHLRGWSDAEIDKVGEVNFDGIPIMYSRAELMAHLLLHERGHHGDVTTLFYQLGLEVPTIEYRFHLRREP
jgi:uncharacterized damage-inducible protein DinB